MAITSDKLTWIYTTYGLNRLTEAMGNPTDKLYLYKFKIGDANGTFYTPSSSATSLVNPITNGTFYINEKSLSLDNTTVSFKTKFPENSSGYEIREIGLYETIDDIDYLFAIGTCQPLVKPNLSDNYIISVDYIVNFKSVNLASTYDQIVINANNEYASQNDLDTLQTTILYIEGNLMDQISTTSHIVGLNRAAQLHERISENHKSYSNASTVINFSNLLNFTTLNKVYSYWVFNYSKYITSTTAIVDISNNGINLDLNRNLNLFTSGYSGLAPYINIDGNNYYSLPSDVPFNLRNISNTGDGPFTLFFLIKNNAMDVKNTLLAKSNYYTNNHSFEINKLDNNSIEVKLFTDSSNYITCTTPANNIPEDIYFLGIRYNGNQNNPILDIYINFKQISCTDSITGTYSGMSDITEPLTSYTINNLGAKQDYVNSTISIISLIKDSITDVEMRSIALSTLSLAGKDTCLIL